MSWLVIGRELPIRKMAGGQNSSGRPVPRPFLKWVGGKGRLLNELEARRPPEFRTYHAPFLGGGAFYFHLVRLNLVHPRMAVLSDCDAELVAAYRAVRDQVEELINYLKQHIYDEGYFYKVRGLDPAALTPAERAARLIYINRVGYNGLIRRNKAGRINTPFGRYDNPLICDQENLRACSDALKLAHLAAWDFEAVLDSARSGDFAYFDPPYFPLTGTANFTSYTAGGFTEQDQVRLAGVFRELAGRGVYCMASNHDVPQVHRLYAGFRIEQVKVTRPVNSKGGRRGQRAAEVIITSY